MIIYKDIVTGDEIISDIYNLKEIDDVVYEVDGKKIIKKAGIDVNIGANPSAEGEDAADLEEGDEHVIDLVEGFRLNSIPFSDKKSLASQLKGYLKEVVKRWKENGKTEDEIKSYQSGIQSYFTKKLVPSFKDLDFYTGETCDPDGMVCFLNYREDGVTPYLIIWKHTLSETKV